MKAVIIVVIAAMAGGGLWAAGTALFGNRGTQPTTEAAAVVATVNGQAISSYDLYYSFIERLQDLEAEQGAISPRSYQAVRFQALEGLIGSVVIGQEITNRKLTASKAEIDQALQDIIDQFASVDEYKAQLSLVGLTEDVLRSRLAEEVKFDKLKKEVMGEYPVSEQEIREMYEQVRASHILITPADTSDEAWAAAEAKAQEVFAEVNVDNFPELAGRYSEDTSSVQGGDIGYVSRGRTVPEFEEAAFGLKVGEISVPVRSQYGYHLIMVTERKEAAGEEFEAVRPLIVDLVRSEKGQADLVAWFTDVRDKATVVYADVQLNAFAQMLEGNYEDAVHYYKLAIEGAPSDGYLNASLGDVYQELGNTDEAIAQYKLATEKYATDHTLFMSLGDLYAEMEQVDEAVDAYLKASELVPYDLFTQLTLYSHLSRFERFEEAKIIEERIAAYQQLQEEFLKAQEQPAAQDSTLEVEAESVEDLVEMPVEETVEAPVDETAPEN